MSRESWAVISDMNPTSDGYVLKTVSTPMKGKGDVEVFHLYQSKRKLVSKIQTISQVVRPEDTPEQKHIRGVMVKLLEAVTKKRDKDNSLGIYELIMQLKPMLTLKQVYNTMSDKPANPAGKGPKEGPDANEVSPSQKGRKPTELTRGVTTVKDNNGVLMMSVRPDDDDNAKDVDLLPNPEREADDRQQDGFQASSV